MLSSEVGGKLDYSPVSWREYFDQMEDVNVGPADSTDIFRIYKAGSDGPLLVLLHGGGHSALSWAVFTVSINATTSTHEGNQIIFLSFVSDSHFQSGDLQNTGYGSQRSWWVVRWYMTDTSSIKDQNISHQVCTGQLHSDHKWEDKVLLLHKFNLWRFSKPLIM